jgi:hypothetical protein
MAKTTKEFGVRRRRHNDAARSVSNNDGRRTDGTFPFFPRLRGHAERPLCSLRRSGPASLKSFPLP